MLINCLRYGLACSKRLIKNINNANYICNNDHSGNAVAVDVSDQNLNYRILFGTLAKKTERTVTEEEPERPEANISLPAIAFPP